MSIQITGLDKLQRDLENAQRALKALDGTVADLKFDRNSQASIDSAIREIEDAIDDKTRPYRGNPFVESVAKGLKAQYRAAILEQAAKSRVGSGDSL
jgi:hypothetical protein